MKWSALLLSLALLAHGEVMSPGVVRLDPSRIGTIPIHTEVDTLLMFPEAVTLIAGKGMTDGKEPGAVFFQQAENPSLLLLRLLQPDTPVLMHLVMGSEGFSFRLVGSENPASIIRFHTDDGTVPAIEIPEDEVRKQKSEMSWERREQLLQLAIGEQVLRPKIPDEYKDFQSRTSESQTVVNGLQIITTKIARFNSENAIVLLADLENHGKTPLELAPELIGIRVGDSRVFSPSHLQWTERQVQPGAKSQLAVLLLGDGRGKSLPISIENQFSVILRSDSNPSVTP